MQQRNYWLDLFSKTTWNEFLDGGGSVSGFRESRWKIVQKVKPGDYLICYLTGISRFVGVYEVVSEPYLDQTPIWTGDIFPSRVKVKEVVGLTPETAIPVFELKDQLSFSQDFKSPYSWTGHFRGSPSHWKPTDGEAVLCALMEAKKEPVIREIDPAKYARYKHVLKPDSDETPDVVKINQTSQTVAEEVKETRLHVEIQHRLLKLGTEMGFNVWVARNDRNREIDGKKFSELFTLKNSLPLQFDEDTTKVIELIDVLWLRGNAIIAAFEVESTTSIYSGLLRMSDLISMQPNLNIPLYLVAPEERRYKVKAEINRPTFSRLMPPLAKLCRYISFTTLRDRLDTVAPYIRFMKPEFLIELSEDCSEK